MVNRKVERVGAGTLGLVDVVIGIGAGCRIGLTVPVEIATDGGIRHVMRAIVDREVERIGAGTLVLVNIVIGVGA